MARLAQRENGWDFASFDYPVRGHFSDWREHRATAYLASRRVLGETLVVGYAVVWQRTSCRRFDLAASTWSGETQQRGVATVDLVFTCQVWRRRGVGRRLVEAIAGANQVSPAALAWSSPFTDAGRALAQAVAGSSEVLVA